MSLLPQDVVSLIALSVYKPAATSFAEWGKRMGSTASQAFQTLERLKTAGLVVEVGRVKGKTRQQAVLAVNRGAMLEFFQHGVRYAYPALRGKQVRGRPTAHAAKPLNEHIVQSDLVVWPDAKGTLRGESVQPLSRSALHVASSNARAYELLALVDAMRIGNARERAIAADLLKNRISMLDVTYEP